jgi:hypothetical protein
MWPRHGPFRDQRSLWQPVIPHEWFLVPLFVIDEAIKKIGNRTIAGDIFDPKIARLVQRENGHARVGVTLDDD